MNSISLVNTGKKGHKLLTLYIDDIDDCDVLDINITTSDYIKSITSITLKDFKDPVNNLLNDNMNLILSKSIYESFNVVLHSKFDLSAYAGKFTPYNLKLVRIYYHTIPEYEYTYAINKKYEDKCGCEKSEIYRIYL